MDKHYRRKRRPKSQTLNPIHITQEEFELLVSYLNIISRNLYMILRKHVNDDDIEFKSIKLSKISNEVICGSLRLENVITVDCSNSTIINSKILEVRSSLLSFAEGNRYLNITQDNDHIKLENSDKYPYFNIEMIESDCKLIFRIYSRRLFDIVGGVKTKKFYFF